MNISLNKVLLGLVAVGGILIVATRTSEDVPSLDEQMQAAEEAANQNYLAGDTETPLSNTNSTLSTIVTQNRQLQNEIEGLREEQRQTSSELDRVKREKANSTNASGEVERLRSQLLELEEKLKTIETESQSNNEKPSTGLVIDPIDITGSDIAPIEVETKPTKTASTNPILDTLIQPGASNPVTDMFATKPAPEMPPQNTNMVTVTQSDVQYIQKDDQTVVREYPIDVAGGKGAKPGTTQNDNLSLPNADLSGLGVEEIKKEIPIYTIPANSTLFGSFSMSALIGRVPINNAVSNPFRFKVIVGTDNLATNGLFMPHVAEMSLSGYAEGDFTLECARGTIDTATFTFHDGTIRTVRSDGERPLGWISDNAGVPCIAGQYITNFPSYAATQGTLATLTSMAGAFAESAVSTTTSEIAGTTTEVITDASKKAVGEGLEAGAGEISKWYAERQSSAFDAVYVEPGTAIVVNIEEEMKIDYTPDGRKLVHTSNAEEYLGW